MLFRYFIICRCGHQGTFDTDEWQSRDDVLRRARCSACGRIGADDLRIASGGGYNPNRWA